MISSHSDISNSNENSKISNSDSRQCKLDLLCLASELCHRRLVTAHSESEREYHKRVGFRLYDAMDPITLPALANLEQNPFLNRQALRLASVLVRAHIAQLETMLKAVAMDLDTASLGEMHPAFDRLHQSLPSVSL